MREKDMGKWDRSECETGKREEERREKREQERDIEKESLHSLSYSMSIMHTLAWQSA